MRIEKIKESYSRNLPHIQPIGAAFFVTFRLKDSIPKAKIWQLKNNFDTTIQQIKLENPVDLEFQLYNERKRFFAHYDALLDAMKYGPTFLEQPAIAELVAKEIHRFDGDLYKLVAYSIMPNHVHILIDTSIQLPSFFDVSKWESLEFEPLSNIMKKIKGPSAVYANRLLDRVGKFWQRESYDHYIRNTKEFNNVIAYILNNPVKAGLAKNWEDHPFTFLGTYS
ncbi:MAG: transposase [Bacteroidota bacterium]